MKNWCWRAKLLSRRLTGEPYVIRASWETLNNEDFRSTGTSVPENLQQYQLIYCISLPLKGSLNQSLTLAKTELMNINLVTLTRHYNLPGASNN